MERSRSRRGRLAARAALALLVAAAVVAARWSRVRAFEPDERGAGVVFWVADRGGGAVVGLGADLHPHRRIEVPWPTRVVPRPDGGVWVVSAYGADPAGSHRLLALDAEGRELARFELGPVLDVDADALGSSAIVRGLATRSWVEVELGRPAQRLLDEPGLRCCARSGRLRLAGGDDGSVLVFDAASGRGRARRLGRRIVDARAGPTAGSFWVLDGADPDRLMLLDPTLEPVRVVELGSGASALVPVPGSERVWVVDAAPARLRLIGRNGAVELDPGSGPLGLGCVDANGALVVARASALARFRTEGAALPGQGGFTLVVDVAAARPAELSSP